MTRPSTVRELKASGYAVRSVKDELRSNLIQWLKERRNPLFEGIVGYQETVEPQIINALLSRHNFALLGLRGQAKSRILRSLVTLLDPEIPVVAGCEIHDSPFQPLCPACRQRFAELGEDLPV
ncbi:MAG: magnesium chelatase, partial [Acidobacteria bacterium]|nr:magnesium chelatase [Acidobacteriota bacterium]